MTLLPFDLLTPNSRSFRARVRRRNRVLAAIAPSIPQPNNCLVPHKKTAEHPPGLVSARQVNLLGKRRLEAIEFCYGRPHTRE